MSLASSVKARAIHCFRVHRSGGFYSSGVWVETGPDDFVARGNIQPSGPDDIQRLPEGARTEGAITVFTRLELRTVAAQRDGVNAQEPEMAADVIEHKGKKYQVATVENWPSHNRYVCTKVGQ